MKTKTLLTALVLALAPAVSAYAACSGHSQQAMTCADGMAYDAATNSCKVVSG